MDLKIIELCDVDPGIDGLSSGIREYCYSSKETSFMYAVMDFEKNFDSDNIFESKDLFDGACTDSTVVAILDYNHPTCTINYNIYLEEEGEELEESVRYNC